MTTVLERSNDTAPAPTPPRDSLPMPRREQLAFMVFATWSVVGLFLDGWSHRHQRLETFFTPWHAVLYSGIAVGALVATIDRRQQRRRGIVPLGFAVAGARLTAIGMGVFVAAGAADMVWHQVFGIERDVAALLSPTHLMLMFGGMLALTGPLRAAWITDSDDAPSFVAFSPVVVSAALAAALGSFFTMFVSPFLMTRLTMAINDQAVGVAGILVATVVLITPVLLLAARWRTPFGTFTVYFTMIGMLIAALDGVGHWPMVLPLAFAGFATDVLLRQGASLTVVAVAVPVVLWSEYFAVFYARGGMQYSAELWSGSVVMAALVGLGLRQLLRAPNRRATRGPVVRELHGGSRD